MSDETRKVAKFPGLNIRTTLLAVRWRLKEAMHDLDLGTVKCPACGAVKAVNPEGRAKWEALSAALARVEKVLNWVPWVDGVSPTKAKKEDCQ